MKASFTRFSGISTLAVLTFALPSGAAAHPGAKASKVVKKTMTPRKPASDETAQVPLFFDVELPAPEGKVNHGQGVVETHPGELMNCWYSGTTEANSDSRILCSFSEDQGKTWTMPAVMVDRQERAVGASERNKTVGNVTLTHDASGRLWMIYGVVQEYHIGFINFCTNWRCGRVDARFSTDQGRTWSVAVRLDDESGALARSKPLHLQPHLQPQGGAPVDLVPLYLEGDQKSYTLSLNLAALREMELPRPVRSEIPMLHDEKLIQPSLVEMPDGSIRAYLRDIKMEHVYTSTFDPVNGLWSPVLPANLPNPNAAIDAWRDDEGNIDLVYNPSQTSRDTLRIASSTDGIHFTEGCDLVAPHSQGDAAYPYVYRSADQLWHVTYSGQDKRRVHQITFNSEWLKSCLKSVLK